MYSTQISRALQSDPYVAPYFEGVFASDRLPRQLTLYPSAVVANTDPASEPGKHWIAFYFDRHGHLDYFDSYGLPPTVYPRLTEFAAVNSRTQSYNDRPLQGFYSDVCGQYCIAFLAMRARDYTLTDVVNYYSGGRPGDGDALVAREVNSLYNIKKRKRIVFSSSSSRGSGVTQWQRQQCCCSSFKSRDHERCS